MAVTLATALLVLDLRWIAPGLGVLDLRCVQKLFDDDSVALLCRRKCGLRASGEDAVGRDETLTLKFAELVPASTAEAVRPEKRPLMAQAAARTEMRLPLFMPYNLEEGLCHRRRTTPSPA